MKTRKFARWIHRVGLEKHSYEAGWKRSATRGNKNPPFDWLASAPAVAMLTEWPRHWAPPALRYGQPPPDGRREIKRSLMRRLWSAGGKLRPSVEAKFLPVDVWRFAWRSRPIIRTAAWAPATALLKKHPNFAAKVIASVESDGRIQPTFFQATDEILEPHFHVGRQKPQSQTRGRDRRHARPGNFSPNVALPFVAAYAEKFARDDRLRSKSQDPLRHPCAPPPTTASFGFWPANNCSTNPIRSQKTLKTTRRQQDSNSGFPGFLSQ